MAPHKGWWGMAVANSSGTRRTTAAATFPFVKYNCACSIMAGMLCMPSYMQCPAARLPNRYPFASGELAPRLEALAASSAEGTHIAG